MYIYGYEYIYIYCTHIHTHVHSCGVDNIGLYYVCMYAYIYISQTPFGPPRKIVSRAAPHEWVWLARIRGAAAEPAASADACTAAAAAAATFASRNFRFFMRHTGGGWERVGCTKLTTWRKSYQDINSAND